MSAFIQASSRWFPKRWEVYGHAAREATRIALLLAALAPAAAADAEGRLAAFFGATSEGNPATIDHAPWQALLAGHLRADHPSGIHRLDYAALQANAAATASLRRYLVALQALDPRQYARAEQLAYWINLYNALTVQLVADAHRNGPVESIRDLGEGWLRLRRGPWRDENAVVAGQALTLDNIEHDILRPIWREPRIHYAVNCASLGCPNLAPAAFTAANAEALLEAGARAYVNHPRGVAFKGDDLVVSSLYDWYREDFGGSDAGILAHLIEHAEAPLAARLRAFDGAMRFAYDWALNAP